MLHLLHVPDPKSTHIKISITETNKCNIDLSNIDSSVDANLSLDELHEYIGTLLHVQQKLKNR
jgi:hypothetical protein